MATIREDISKWLQRGISSGATHLIVATDTYDYEDYPVLVMPGEDVRLMVDEIRSKSMTRVMEVYSYSLPLEPQIEAVRAFNY